MTTVAAAREGAMTAHPALFYRDSDEYLAGVGAFVRGGLEAGRPVLVAVPGSRLDWLRSSLGSAARAADFVDMSVLGRNPGRILALLQAFADSAADGPVRLVGEPIWPGRSPAETVEATRHEALINTAFAGRDVSVLCPYDVKGLPADTLVAARRTHPTVIEDGLDTVSPAYEDPRAVCADCDLPLAEPEAATVLAYRAGQLGEVRDLAHAWADDTALDRVRRGDLVLAISEAAANSIVHGGGSGVLRLWTTASGDVVAEIRDGGRLSDPLAGRRRPSLNSANGGRGLWLIHQVADLVEVRALRTGLTLRLHFRVS